MVSDEKKKISVIALSVILTVAMFVIVMVAILAMAVLSAAIFYESHVGENVPVKDSNLSTTSNAVKAICQPTSYRETCEQTLSSANTSDPHELIKLAFKAALTNIDEAIKNSSLLKKASTDPNTSQAFDICKEVLNTSMEDIKRSMNKVSSLGFLNFANGIDYLKTWIGGAITFHETCLDAFENTTGDTGEKMKELLKTSGELTSNGLAMVCSLTEVLDQLDLHISNSSRKLLQYGNQEFPSMNDLSSFVDSITDGKLPADDGNTIPTPNITVAKDGTGQFTTISDALKTYIINNNAPFIIFVKAGVYVEHVHIPKYMTRVVLIGEGPTKTKITGSKNFADGTKTFLTATVAIDGDYFIAKDIGFENSAGPEKHQAVAIRVTGDFSVLLNCQIDGYQDSLYAHNKRQFYKNCTISGTIDFVFGDAQAIFQDCTFIVRKPLPNQACMVTAQGRKDRYGPGGLVLRNCTILPSPELQVDKTGTKVYLGRPWKEYSRTVIMDSYIDGFIAPAGWAPWMGDFALDTCYFAEYKNKGPGAKTTERVTWKGIKKNFKPNKYYLRDDAWVKDAITSL